MSLYKGDVLTVSAGMLEVATGVEVLFDEAWLDIGLPREKPAFKGGGTGGAESSKSGSESTKERHVFHSL